jgi:hypothetical protein
MAPSAMRTKPFAPDWALKGRNGGSLFRPTRRLTLRVLEEPVLTDVGVELAGEPEMLEVYNIIER